MIITNYNTPGIFSSYSQDNNNYYLTALWLPELPHTPFAILTVVFQKPADWSDKEPAEGIKSLGSEIPEKNQIT